MLRPRQPPDRHQLDRAERAVELLDPGAGIEGLGLDPAVIGQEAVVGRRLDRLAVDPEVLDLGIFVDRDGGDRPFADLAGVGIADGVASRLPARSRALDVRTIHRGRWGEGGASPCS